MHGRTGHGNKVEALIKHINGLKIDWTKWQHS